MIYEPGNHDDQELFKNSNPNNGIRFLILLEINRFLTDIEGLDQNSDFKENYLSSFYKMIRKSFILMK